MQWRSVLPPVSKVTDMFQFKKPDICVSEKLVHNNPSVDPYMG